LVLLNFAPQGVNAQNSSEIATVFLNCTGQTLLTDEDSKLTLEGVQKNYQDLKKFTSKFKQVSYLAAMDLTENGSGMIKYLSPGSMRWIYNQPEVQEFLIKDNAFWFFQPQDQQVLIQPLEEVLSSDLPLSFLFGLGNLRKDFKLAKACKNLKDGTSVLFLEPKGDKDLASFTQVALKTNKQSLPSVIEVKHLGGNVTSIFIDQYDTNTEVNTKDFNLLIPKGMDIIDKR
jgi:outer membrane lipoprotein-sorting protein